MNSHILLFCKDVEPYTPLISQLAKKYIVAVSCNLVQFSSHIKRRSYDLVLLEIPEDESLLLNIVAEIVALKNTPSIIVIGGSSLQLPVAEAFRLGIRDFFPEPVEIGLLVERVGAMLN